MDSEDFQLAQAYAQSTLVPAQFKDSVPNVLLAIDYARCLGDPVLVVMHGAFFNEHGEMPEQDEEYEEDEPEPAILSDEQERFLSSVMAGGGVDTQAVVAFVNDHYGLTHISDVNDEQAKELTTMIESGDFAPLD